jgi:hypothetical protein
VDHTTLLGIHITAGALGLLIGPIAIWQDTRSLRTGQGRAGGAGSAYLWVVLVISLTAIVLVVRYRDDLWWLAPVAGLSYGLAALGRFAAGRRFRGWSHAYVHGQGGSYIALVTAFLVVALTVDGPFDGAAAILPWVLPTIVGTVLIEVWRRRIVAALE